MGSFFGVRDRELVSSRSSGSDASSSSDDDVSSGAFFSFSSVVALLKLLQGFDLPFKNESVLVRTPQHLFVLLKSRHYFW
jgi:hypothetical protein